MGLAMASLLMHSELVPAAAREALKAAHEGAPERRGHHLESAARILYDEAGVDCAEARELVDLLPEDCVGTKASGGPMDHGDRQHTRLLRSKG